MLCRGHDMQIVQRVVGRLSLGQSVELLTMFKESAARHRRPRPGWGRCRHFANATASRALPAALAEALPTAVEIETGIGLPEDSWTSNPN
jgi:hypothetical protein